MPELIYRIRKYIQAKSDEDTRADYLKYCGHEIMSKKIYEAMKAEMG
tara:strand:+ start:1143 stop:1283 length:141 start_codon:yes stop_codon:yes gene_type:complete